MFIQHLYRDHKWLCFATIGFLLLYGYLNYKWGMTATPVQLYGMYSGKHYVNDPQEIFLTEANGVVIRDADLSITDRDFLQSFPRYYHDQEAINANVWGTMRHYFQAAGMATEQQAYKFRNEMDDRQFNAWYLRKVAGIIHKPVTTLTIYRQQVAWKDDALVAINTPVKERVIVPD